MKASLRQVDVELLEILDFITYNSCRCCLEAEDLLCIKQLDNYYKS